MKLEQSNLIVKRAYKEVYKCDEGIVKVFEKTHSKADVFNEALFPPKSFLPKLHLVRGLFLK